MFSMSDSERIYGDEIFFNFIELPFSSIDKVGDLVHQIKSKVIAGFIIKDVFTANEVNGIKNFLETLTEEEFMPTPSGKIFPAPFAVITDIEERLDAYYSKLDLFIKYKNNKEEIKVLTDKLDLFFKNVSKKNHLYLFFY